MSSGYFPLRRDDGWGKELVGHIEGLKALYQSINDAEQEIMVAEDALYDGRNLGEMNIAIDFLDRLLEKAKEGEG